MSRQAKTTTGDSISAGKRGVLQVRTGTVFKSWKQRWFAIEGQQLVHYSDDKYKSVFKKYELLNREAGAVPTKDPPRKENCVRLAGKEPRNARQARKYYFFVAASEADQLAWVDAIKAVNGKAELRKENLVFEVNLIELRESNPSAFDSNRQLPVLIIKCVEFLSKGSRSAEEGIFRLGGNHDRIQELRQQFDLGRNPSFDDKEDPHVVAGLIKLYLRRLPEPLLLFANYTTLISTCRDAEDTLPDVLKKAIAALPLENHLLLKYLADFLVSVSQHAEKSKMGINNLATVFGPNLLREKVEDAVKMMSESDLITRVTVCILKNAATLFPAPDDLPGSTLAAPSPVLITVTPADEPVAAKVEVETAKVEAETAKVEVETAKVEVETAEVDVETAKIDVETAKVEAETNEASAEEVKAEEPAKEPEAPVGFNRGRRLSVAAAMWAPPSVTASASSTSIAEEDETAATEAAAEPVHEPVAEAAAEPPKAELPATVASVKAAFNPGRRLSVAASMWAGEAIANKAAAAAAEEENKAEDKKVEDEDQKEQSDQVAAAPEPTPADA